jgi:hypothetical protein
MEMAEFDEPDIAADHELIRGIMAGRIGLHPDAWFSYEPMRITAAREKEPDEEPLPVDPAWEAKQRRRPVEESPPKPRREQLPYVPPFAVAGEVQLTCDVCRKGRLDTTLKYRHGQRPQMVEAIRTLGALAGWTCIAGIDRCPACSQVPPPEAIGNGAGADQGHKQHG